MAVTFTVTEEASSLALVDATADGSQGGDPSPLVDCAVLTSSEAAEREILDRSCMALVQLRLVRGRLETAIDGQRLLAKVTRADNAITLT